MKKTLIKVSAIFLSSALLFAACAKKKDSTSSPADDTAQQTTSASDQSNVSTESDQGLNDAQTVIAGSSSNERIALVSSGGNTANIPGATIDTSGYASGLFIIHYNGLNGLSGNGSRMRTGTITVQRTNGKWSTPGSVLTLTFTNYTVTRQVTGKSITLNGKYVVTNVSTVGYTWANLPVGSSIDHKVRGMLSITFDDGTIRAWEIARHRKTTNQGNYVYTVAISGDTAVNNYSNVEAWGTNRNGENFYGEITTPIVYSTACLLEPISGVYVHQGIVRTLTVTFGVNSDGTPNTSANCPYGFKMDWTNLSNVAKELIIGY